jgi:hypothetical protein
MKRSKSEIYEEASQKSSTSNHEKNPSHEAAPQSLKINSNNGNDEADFILEKQNGFDN